MFNLLSLDSHSRNITVGNFHESQDVLISSPFSARQSSHDYSSRVYLKNKVFYFKRKAFRGQSQVMVIWIVFYEIKCEYLFSLLLINTLL